MVIKCSNKLSPLTKALFASLVANPNAAFSLDVFREIFLQLNPDLVLTGDDVDDEAIKLAIESSGCPEVTVRKLVNLIQKGEENWTPEDKKLKREALSNLKQQHVKRYVYACLALSRPLHHSPINSFFRLRCPETLTNAETWNNPERCPDL